MVTYPAPVKDVPNSMRGSRNALVNAPQTVTPPLPTRKIPV